LFFALGFSTKWYVLYGFAGQGFVLAVLAVKNLFSSNPNWGKRAKSLLNHRLLMITGLLLMAVAVYFSTFIPFIMIGHTPVDVYERQWAMFTYHSSLEASHPFSSEWWSWPLVLRPVWLYVSDLPGDVSSTIAALGNPGVWWVGFGSLLFLVGKMVKSRGYLSSFIATIFFFQWLPYAFITRCLFLYHFYVNVPFLCLATTYLLNETWFRRRDRLISLSYLLGVTVLFAMFFPVISGCPAPSWWREWLRWLGSWVF
jgi:hypothetical protein